MSYQILHGVLMAAHRVSKITPDQIFGKGRAYKVARVRQAAIYAMRNRTDWSLPHIGRVFGGRDHSTVLHAVRLIGDMLGDPDVATMVAAMMDAPQVNMAEYDRWIAGLRGVKPQQEKRCFLKPVAKAEPAPTRVKREELPSPLKWFASVDEDGQCYSERFMQFDMRRGSEKLRRAIVLARAA